MPAICPNPVFIIGSARSGTTVLARSLAEHSELWTSGEFYVFFHLFGPANFAQRAFDRAMEIPGPRWLRREGVSREEFLAYVGMGVNALITNRSEGRRWVDHTAALNALIVDRLAAVFPGASFVHILRDGREVVNSMLNFAHSRPDAAGTRFAERRIGWASGIRGACEAWRDYVEAAAAFSDEHADRATTVRYEDLVAAPEATFARMHHFLGIADETGPTDFLASGRINSSFGGGPRLSGDELWETWDEERRRTFAELAGATMLSCGYGKPDELESPADAARPSR